MHARLIWIREIVARAEQRHSGELHRILTGREDRLLPAASPRLGRGICWDAARIGLRSRG